MVLDGNGNITGGEQDAFNFDTSTLFTADAIQPATGAVVVGNDGRGTITLTPTLAPVETLSIAVVNSSHVLITEFDLRGNHHWFDGSANRSRFYSHRAQRLRAVRYLRTTSRTAGCTPPTILPRSQREKSTPTSSLQMDFDDGVTGSYTAPDAAGRGTITLSLPTFVKEMLAPKNSERPLATGRRRRRPCNSPTTS